MDATLKPAAMHNRYGPILRALFRRYFGPVHFPEEAERELQELARRGTLVYVMRSAGILNFLYFNWAFAQRGLPLAKAILGLATWLYRPVAALFSRRPSEGPDAVLQAVEQGEAAMVFLRRPAVLRSQGASTDDPFPRLIELQRRSPRPIFLVPQLLILKRAPVRIRPGVADVVLGSAEVPSRVHAFVSFLFNYRRALVRVGKPIDLAEVVRSEAGTEDAVIARKVRGSLAVGLGRELRVVVGPPLKDAERVRDEILRDRVLREELAKIAQITGRPEDVVLREARRCLREIAARYSPAFVDGANTVARWVFHRLYDGVHVDEDGLRRAADAAKRAPLVICPTHRSHVDYLLVSHVLFERGMTPPQAAAGANLSFWPLGPLLRRGGAFFIRRSFKGDRVYGAALSAYVRKLAREGIPQEFYPEGGRTRTGRILQPKYGLISMEVEAWLAGARDDLFFLPVAIDYEKLIESGAYAKELAGGEKQKEDIKGLLRVPGVLRSKWGRVFLQVDEPISLKDFAAARSFDPASGEDERRSLVRALAHRIAYGMGRVQTISARALAAAVVLSHRSRGLSAKDLATRFELLRSLARERRARFSPGLAEAPADPLLPGPVRDALLEFEADDQLLIQEAGGETIYQVKEEARAQLSFYKSNVVHHFQDESLLAMALLSFTAMRAGEDELVAQVELVSRLLKRELSFRTNVPLTTIVADVAAGLAVRGLVAAAGGTIEARPGARETLVFLRELLADVVESYHVAVLALADAAGGPTDKKELVRLFLDRGKALYLAGRVFAAESLSRATFENAVEWLAEQGHLAAAGEKKLVLAGEFATAEGRASFARELERVLQR